MFRGGEPEGVLCSRDSADHTAVLHAGDLIEIGDVRGLVPGKSDSVVTFRLCSGSYAPAVATTKPPAPSAAPPKQPVSHPPLRDVRPNLPAANAAGRASSEQPEHVEPAAEPTAAAEPMGVRSGPKSLRRCAAARPRSSLCSAT